MVGRDLSSGERLIWFADRQAPLNFVLVASLESELSVEALGAGLGKTACVHPILRSSVGLHLQRPCFVAAERPIEVADAVGRPWAEVAQEQLNAPFDCPREPLARLIRVQHEGCHVLLVLHHSLGDGVSGLLLLREILTGAAAWLRGETASPSAIPMAAPLEERRLLGAELPSAPVVEGLRLHDEEVEPANRETVIIAQLLGQEQTRALVARTRAHEVSVHGLLAACQLQALAAEHGGLARLSLSSPYNLRSRLEPPVGEGLGLFIGDARNSYRVDADAAPWELAAAVSADVGRAARAGASMGSTETREIDLGRIYADRVSTAMSNLGVFPMGAGLEPIGVQALHFAVACSVLGDQIGAVVTANGRLAHTFCAMSPTLSRSRIGRISA